jgi:hypothetical protein
MFWGSAMKMESYMVYNTTLRPDPEKISAWLEKNEAAIKAYERTLEIVNETLEANPQDAGAWRNKSLSIQSRLTDHQRVIDYQLKNDIRRIKFFSGGKGQSSHID